MKLLILVVSLVVFGCGKQPEPQPSETAFVVTGAHIVVNGVLKLPTNVTARSAKAAVTTAVRELEK